MADNREAEKGIQVQRSVTILNKTPDELYRFWRDVENLPRFMVHLVSVEKIDARRSRWEARGPVGNVSWESVIEEDVPGRRISWSSAEGADVPNSGSVEFRPAPGGRGTEVQATVSYRPPLGKAGALFAKVRGEEPSQQIREDLRHLKQLLEAGEIPTIVGQSAGKR